MDHINGNATPPHSIDAEQSVLGGMMLDHQRVPDVLSALDDDDFYNRHHRLIYRAIERVYEMGAVPDSVTLAEYLEKHHAGEVDTGYIITLASETPSAANLAAYVNIVREKSTLRRLIDAGTEITNLGFNPGDDDATSAYHRALGAITAIEPALGPSPPPMDLFGDFQPPRLRREWLPPAIADFVFEASEVKSCHPETLFMSALSACAAATHDNFQVQPRPNEPGWRESARLWVMVVGTPSQKKTPAMKLAMRGLSDMNSEMIDRNLAAQAEHDRAMVVHRLQEKKRAQAEAKGEGFNPAVDAPKAPKHERIITSDFTVEGIARLLVDNERGLLAWTDELAAWFGKMGKYSGNGGGDDRAQWLQFYEGGPKPIDRAGKTVLVPNASVSVIGGIQPDKMRALASTMADDGLLQRFIITVLPPGALPDCEKPEPTALIRAYADLISHIYATTTPGPVLIPMSPEAVVIRRELDTWRMALADSDGLPSMLRSALMKYEGLFPRLCMVYHSVGCAHQRKYPGALVISGNTARRVADLIKHWIFPNAMAFYTGIMGAVSPGFALARAVADSLLATDKVRVTRRDITHVCKAWRGAADWQQAAALTALEQASWITPARNRGAEGAGRTVAWTVNPRVRVDFAQRAVEARAKRAAVAAIFRDLRQAGTDIED